MTLDLAFLAFAAAVLVLAGFVKGVIGLGLPTISIGLLGLVMAPAQAAALLVVPNLVTNVWQLAGTPGLAALSRRIAPMLAGVVVGTFAGLPLLTAQGSRLASGLLGASLALYAAIGLARPRWRVAARHERSIGAIAGALTGLCAAATGVFVLPAVPFLHALDLDKEDLVQALGLSFLVSTIALAAALATAGLFAVATAGASLAALLPALAGMAIGQAVRHRVSAETFRFCFLAGLALLGLYLAARALA
ncbi:MAG: sulfite exporter TauE/SafE family protein [Alphaproteobacteria bacterium]|nr:sulfite exporter TauE/SafE family protein [Alphaproteobacteria bacterium]